MVSWMQLSAQIESNLYSYFIIFLVNLFYVGYPWNLQSSLLKAKIAMKKTAQKLEE